MAATIASPSPLPPLPRSRPPSARQKRSNSSVAAVGRAGPGRGRATSRPHVAAVAADGRPRSACRRACGRARCATRLASTWRSWSASPSTIGARPSARRAIGAVRARSRGRRRPRRAASGGEVDRLASSGRRLVEPGERQQVLDQHAHARGLVLDPPHRLRRRPRRRARRPCGTARRSRGSRPAACAARATRRRRTGAAGPRWPARSANASSMRSSIALSATPSRPTSVRGVGRLDALARGRRRRSAPAVSLDAVERAQAEAHDDPGDGERARAGRRR